MTGAQLKDLWSQWTVQTKTSWLKLIGPYMNDTRRTDAMPDIGPKQQGAGPDLPKPDTRGEPVRLGE